MLIHGLSQRTDVLSRDHQHVNRRFGIDVGEGVNQVVLINGRRWNFTRRDLAKKAAHGVSSVHATYASGCAIARPYLRACFRAAKREKSTAFRWQFSRTVAPPPPLQFWG